MKQREDTLTPDMFGNMPIPTVFRFYVETTSGETIEWEGLTKKQARDMYAYTNASQPSNAKSFGWEATK